MNTPERQRRWNGLERTHEKQNLLVCLRRTDDGYIAVDGAAREEETPKGGSCIGERGDCLWRILTADRRSFNENKMKN